MAIGIPPGDPVARHYAACVHARRGQAKAALDELERAIALGYRHLEWIASESHCQPLRAEPCFRARLAGYRPREKARRARAGRSE